MTQILEGTWEEIAARADEFKGCRVQLKVLSAPPSSANGAAGEARPQNLAEALAGRIGKFDFEPTDLAARSEEYFGQIVEEKHRRIKERRSQL